MTMQHAGPLECSERKAPCHLPMRQGGGAEEKVDIGGGTAGEIGEVLSGLWCSFEECAGVQVSREGDNGGI